MLFTVLLAMLTMVYVLAPTPVLVMRDTGGKTAQRSALVSTENVTMVSMGCGHCVQSHSCSASSFPPTPGPAGTGTCSSCEGDFVGANCEISLACTVVPAFVGLALVITGIVILAVWYIRRCVILIGWLVSSVK